MLITGSVLRQKDYGIYYKHKKIMTKTKFINMSSVFIAFILLFTPWKGFGIVIFLGIIFQLLFTRESYKNLIKS